MKVFITGGLGQIGSHIAELLLENDENVFVLDNLSTGRKDHLRDNKKLNVVIGSISDKELINKIYVPTI